MMSHQQRALSSPDQSTASYSGDGAAQHLSSQLHALPANKLTVDALRVLLHGCTSRFLASVFKRLEHRRATHRAFEVFTLLRSLPPSDPLSALCDKYTYSTMMSQCTRPKGFKAALKMLDEMKERGIERNRHTYSSLMSVCLRAEKLDMALKMYHDLLAEGLEPCLVTYHTLMDIYGHMGQWEKSVELLDKILAEGMEPEVRTFNIAIIACGRCNHIVESIRIFERLIDAGVRPCVTTYTSLISLFCRVGQLQEGMLLLESMQRAGIQPNVITYSALINGCAKTGDLQSALFIFRQMQQFKCQPSVVTYNTLLKACDIEGDWLAALWVWRHMQDSACRPDVVSFRSLLSVMHTSGRWPVLLHLYVKQVLWGIQNCRVLADKVLDTLWCTGSWEARKCALQLFRQSDLAVDINAPTVTGNVVWNGKVHLPGPALCMLLTWLDDLRRWRRGGDPGRPVAPMAAHDVAARLAAARATWPGAPQDGRAVTLQMEARELEHAIQQSRALSRHGHSPAHMLSEASMAAHQQRLSAALAGVNGTQIAGMLQMARPAPPPPPPRPAHLSCVANVLAPGAVWPMGDPGSGHFSASAIEGRYGPLDVGRLGAPPPPGGGGQRRWTPGPSAGSSWADAELDGPPSMLPGVEVLELRLKLSKLGEQPLETIVEQVYEELLRLRSPLQMHAEGHTVSVAAPRAELERWLASPAAQQALELATEGLHGPQLVAASAEPRAVLPSHAQVEAGLRQQQEEQDALLSVLALEGAHYPLAIPEHDPAAMGVLAAALRTLQDYLSDAAPAVFWTAAQVLLVCLCARPEGPPGARLASSDIARLVELSNSSLPLLREPSGGLSAGPHAASVTYGANALPAASASGAASGASSCPALYLPTALQLAASDAAGKPAPLDPRSSATVAQLQVNSMSSVAALAEQYQSMEIGNSQVPPPPPREEPPPPGPAQSPPGYALFPGAHPVHGPGALQHVGLDGVARSSTEDARIDARTPFGAAQRESRLGRSPVDVGVAPSFGRAAREEVDQFGDALGPWPPSALSGSPGLARPPPSGRSVHSNDSADRLALQSAHYSPRLTPPASDTGLSTNLPSASSSLDRSTAHFAPSSAGANPSLLDDLPFAPHAPGGDDSPARAALAHRASLPLLDGAPPAPDAWASAPSNRLGAPPGLTQPATRTIGRSPLAPTASTDSGGGYHSSQGTLEGLASEEGNPLDAAAAPLLASTQRVAALVHVCSLVGIAFETGQKSLDALPRHLQDADVEVLSAVISRLNRKPLGHSLWHFCEQYVAALYPSPRCSEAAALRAFVRDHMHHVGLADPLLAYPPSLLAAAFVTCARAQLHLWPEWPQALVALTGYMLTPSPSETCVPAGAVPEPAATTPLFLLTIKVATVLRMRPFAPSKYEIGRAMGPDRSLNQSKAPPRTAHSQTATRYLVAVLQKAAGLGR